MLLYQWILVGILLMIINGYFMVVMNVIILMAISGYFIGGYECYYINGY